MYFTINPKMQRRVCIHTPSIDTQYRYSVSILSIDTHAGVTPTGYYRGSIVQKKAVLPRYYRPKKNDSVITSAVPDDSVIKIPLRPPLRH